MKYIDKEKSITAVFNFCCGVCNNQFVSKLPDINIKVTGFDQVKNEKFLRTDVTNDILNTYVLYEFEYVWKLSYLCPNCGYKHLIAYIKSGDTKTQERLAYNYCKD